MVQCNLVKDLTFFCLVWINRNNFAYSSALFTVSLTLVVRASATMARFSIETIGINKICHLLYIVMIFSLPISKEMREFLRLILIEDVLF